MKTRGPLAGLILATAALLPAAEPGDVDSGERTTGSISAIQPVSLNLAAGLSAKEDDSKKEASKSDDGEVAGKESSAKKQDSASEKAAKNADTKAESKDSSKSDGKEVSRDKPAKRKPLKRKVLVVKAAWCGACQSLNYEWPKLRKVRWRIGGASTDHFQLIDVDANPDVVGRYGITQLPTLLLIENGKVLQRAGGLNAKDLAEFYYGRL